MSIASLLRSDKPRQLTPDEEKLKRQLYERIPARRRKFIDRIGYDKWDPFPEPNDPVEIRTDITKRTAQQLLKEFQTAAVYSNPNLAAGSLVGARGDAMRMAAANEAGAMTGFMGMGMAQSMGGNEAALFGMGQQLAQQAPA